MTPAPTPLLLPPPLLLLPPPLLLLPPPLLLLLLPRSGRRVEEEERGRAAPEGRDRRGCCG